MASHTSGGSTITITSKAVHTSLGDTILIIRQKLSHTSVGGPINIVATGPIVSAGPNITVSSGGPIQITGLDTATGAPIVTRTWSFGGTTISASAVLSTIAPLTSVSVTRTYRYTATDSNGASSFSDVAVTVRPSARRIKTDSGQSKPSARRIAGI